jgi:hypothetical protein
MTQSESISGFKFSNRYSTLLKFSLTIALFLCLGNNKLVAQESLDIISGGSSNNTWIYYSTSLQFTEGSEKTYR